MYKDKDKQREANRQAQARFKAKGITEGITKQGITERVLPKTARGNIRVSKPGDPDYIPECETTKAFIDNRPKRPEAGKRGKDIKCFEELPPDIQANIRRLSATNEEFQKRTAIAIRYQHTFPGRYYSTGVA